MQMYVQVTRTLILEQFAGGNAVFVYRIKNVMVLFVRFSALLFFLSLAQVAESQVTITNEPSNPLRVLETKQATLEWTYSIEGSTFRKLEFKISGSDSFIVDAFFVGAPIIRDDRVTLNITGRNVTITFDTMNRNDSDDYLLIVQAADGKDSSSSVQIIVNYAPSLTARAQDQVVVEGGSSIQLNCAADGEPKPNITWTKVSNGSDGDILSTGENLVLPNNRSSEGTYRCSASNGIGNDVNHTATVVVIYPPSLTTRAQDQVVVEGGSPIQLNCVADGKPKPNITWTKVSNGSDGDILSTGENLVLPNNRSSEGTYRCKASNGIGNDVNHTATVVVHFKPENFIFEVENTNENICKGDALNITCSAEGSPSVHTYQLFQNNILVHTSNSSELFWGDATTVGGEVIYTCAANNSVSTANTTRTVTVNVSSSIMPISNEVITEGGNVNLSCQAFGIPPPTVFWVNSSNGERTNGTELVIRNIRRSEAGEYRCEATNPCGNASKSATIDVQYPPEGIQLHVSEEEVCNGTTISFNCSAETANPMKLNYQLYENNIMIGVISNTGVWSKTSWTVGGVFVYKCVVNNSVGTAMSSNVSVKVNVSSSIMPISNEVITEGGNVNLSCQAFGIPPPTVFWVNSSNGERTNGTELVIRNISRNEAGEYRCEATNPCGNASESATIDVQYPPEGIQFHVSEEEVCNGTTIFFNCSAETANPMELNYQLYENNMMIGVISSTGVWNKTMTVGGVFVYKCVVDNSVGTAMSSTVSVNVNVSSSIMPISNEVITEGGNVNLSCQATGIPPPTVFWVNISNGERTNGTELVIRNIRRSEAGEYRCEARNPCGNASESATIDVQYPPEGIQLHVSEEEVCNGTTISFSCSAETANPMELNYQLYENNMMIGVISSTGIWNKTMTVGGVFVYKCMVNNSVGTAMSSNVSVNVNVSSSIRTISDKVVREGGDLTLFCNASGIPEPLVSWVNVSNDQLTHGKELTFENITRYQAGEYRCEATNPCGSTSESATIDVHFKPDMVVLDPSATTVCPGDIIVFNCSAYSNPEVHTYELHVNGTMVNESSKMGIWNITMANGGVFVYKCMVNNSIGTAMSMDVPVTVNEPSFIRPFTKKNIIEEEEEDLTIMCEANGTPPPNVSWVKTSDGERTFGKQLVFTYINRNKAGEYRCEASNLCGNASESVEIDVFFKPEMVQLFASEETVNYGASITFNCSAYSHPMVHAYHLYENGNMVEQISSTGVWTRTMSTEGKFVFKCMVNNTVGTAMSPNVSVTVSGEKCKENCADGKECLAFGTKYFCRCPDGKTGENCQQNDAPVDRVEVGFQFTKAEFIPEYEDLENQKTILFIQTVKQAIKTEMNGTGLRDVIVQRLRRGSVIADVELLFNSSVAKDAIKGLIEEALEDKKLGNLDVGQFKFDGVIPVPTEQPIQCSQFFEGPDCKQATGALIALIVVAVVVVVALLIAIVACSLQKKNATGQESAQNGKYSQRQDPEGHGTVGKEGNVYGGVTSGRNGHGSVNTGFEDETAQGGTPMVTFNSNNAQTPGITLNDSRSQKAQPGEGTYADLGDFQQTPSSTTVPTGPLKRGPKYEETPYAEITQFLQGPVEPEKEESPEEVPVNLEGPLEEPEDDVKDDALNNLNDDARDQSNEQTNAQKLYPSLKEVDGGNKPAQFEVSI
ncbi:hemicentin-1-like isoform X2 [Montipora foliosa]|uniref:hemicentin-1-like isoform X2 n=1 Tax=Montipora foliosa TaxID=591990 RepID=UPI0035F0FF60